MRPSPDWTSSSDEQDVVLAADLSDLAEVSGGGNLDAGFALDGFDQEGAGVGRDCCAEGLGVAEGDFAEACGEGAEAVAVLLV